MVPVEQIYREYGCQVNRLSVRELFDVYERAGFLYPEKQNRLRSHFRKIIDNWERVIGSADDLMFTVSTSPGRDANLATITSWRSTSRGWVTQHLACLGNPIQSRAVMLSTCAARTKGSNDESHQLWFRPDNKFPRRVFGSMVGHIGPKNSSVMTYSYFALPRLPQFNLDSGEVSIRKLNHSLHNAFMKLARNSRGSVYACAEELDKDDFCLDSVDALYRKVGLRRFRDIRMAYAEGSSEPIAATVTYRGPLGLNFSFLENRTDVLVASAAPPAALVRALPPLLQASLETYEEFELGWIPVLAPDSCASVLVARGAQLIRQYSQGIWLRDGFWDWFHHVDGFYSRLVERQSRRNTIHERQEP